MLIANPSSSLKKLIVFPYIILVIAGLTVPSDGSHGFLNIKSLAYIATALTVTAYALTVKKISLQEWKVVCLLLASMTFMAIWFIIGVLYEETPTHSAWEQCKILWLTISVVAFSTYLNYEKLISFAALLKLMLLTNFAYSSIKVMLVILHCLGMIDLWNIVDALGVRFMSMDILGILPRFQTSIDIVTPFLLFFFLQSKQFGIHWSKIFKAAYLIISFFSIFLSFSRFLTFIAILSLMLHALTVKSVTIIRIISITSIAILAIIAWIGVDDLYAVAERRFFSLDNFNSDLARREQVSALIGEFEKFPLLGKGLGGYAPDMIRDNQLLYSYEVQWIAALMQFGLAGLSLLLIPIFIIARKLLSLPMSKEKTALFILFLSWLFAGFTNPFLLSLTSGLVYSLFLLAGDQLAQKSLPSLMPQPIPTL